MGGCGGDALGAAKICGSAVHSRRGSVTFRDLREGRKVASDHSLDPQLQVLKKFPKRLRDQQELKQNN